MNTPNASLIRSKTPLWNCLSVLMLSLVLVAMAGCGSTKVYTADKTITYNGALYNMGNVQRISSRIEGQQADGTKVGMSNLEKKEAEALIKANPEMMVSTVVVLDDADFTYQRMAVKKYSDFDKLKRNLLDAMDDINKFMGDKKKTQLKLK